MPSLPVALYPSVFLSADSWVVGRKASSEVESSRSEFPYNCQLRVLQNAETFNGRIKLYVGILRFLRFLLFTLLGWPSGRIGLLAVHFLPQSAQTQDTLLPKSKTPSDIPRRPFTFHPSRITFFSSHCYFTVWHNLRFSKLATQPVEHLISARTVTLEPSATFRPRSGGRPTLKKENTMLQEQSGKFRTLAYPHRLLHYTSTPPHRTVTDALDTTAVPGVVKITLREIEIDWQNISRRHHHQQSRQPLRLSSPPGYRCEPSHKGRLASATFDFTSKTPSGPQIVYPPPRRPHARVSR